MSNTKFASPFAIVCFLISFTLSELILSLPIVFSRIAGTATYMLSIYITLIITVLLLTVSRLYRPFYGIGLFTVAKYVGGKFFSKIASGLYFIAFIIVTTLFLREVSETMKILLFDTTSVRIISIFFTISMIIGCNAGFEGIVRACGYIIPIAILGIIITLIFSTPYWDINRLYPILGHGIDNIFVYGFPRITAYLGFIYLFNLVTYVDRIEDLDKMAYIYIAASFVIITLCVFANTVTFAYPYTDSNYFALYELAKLTNLNSFFLRSEIIYIFTLMIVAFIFIISMFYGTLKCFCKTLAITSNIWVNIILGIIIYSLSNIPHNLLEVFNAYNLVNNILLLPVTFILPFIILGIANIKRLKNRSSYEKFISSNN